MAPFLIPICPFISKTICDRETVINMKDDGFEIIRDVLDLC